MSNLVQKLSWFTLVYGAGRYVRPFLCIFLHILLGKLCNFLHTILNKGGVVKRKIILRKLTEAGFTFQEGGNHTKAYDPQGRYRTTISRHAEINDDTVRKIEKQTGVKLL